jgi:hypothetical protein
MALAVFAWSSYWNSCGIGRIFRKRRCRLVRGHPDVRNFVRGATLKCNLVVKTKVNRAVLGEGEGAIAAAAVASF